MLTDPVADMLTRIRNANKALHDRAAMPNSKLKVEIARILKEEGYIRTSRRRDARAPHATLVVELKYGRSRERVITDLKRVSKPGRRIYARKDRLPRVLGGMGTAILSTSRGVVTSRTAEARASAAKSSASSGNAAMSVSVRQPIEVPAGVIVSVDPGRVTVYGPKGELRQDVPPRMSIAQDDGTITVARPTERGEDRALHGLTRTLIANMVEGVTNGFKKRLEIQGVGYRAARGHELVLQVGYSHRSRSAPRGHLFEVPIPTQVDVRGIDKQIVGQTAAEIRKVRPPEPYKGKGIRYEGEFVRRKVGKRA